MAAIATEHGSYRLKVLKRGRVIETDCDVFQVNYKSWLVNASSGADFNTPMPTASAQVTAQDQISGNGGMAIQGGSGTPLKGNVAQSGGSYTTDQDVVASSTSLHDHKHPGDSGGVTGSPV
jgi:phage gp45-like